MNEGGSAGPPGKTLGRVVREVQGLRACDRSTVTAEHELRPRQDDLVGWRHRREGREFA